MRDGITPGGFRPPAPGPAAPTPTTLVEQATAALTAALQALPAQLAQAVQAAAAQVSGSLTATLALPLSPKTLNEMIEAADVKGQVLTGVWTVPMSVPAGATVSLVQPVRPGTVHVFLAPVVTQATYYDPAITVATLVDGVPLVPQGLIFSLTGEMSIPLGQYFYVRQSIGISVTNASAHDTVINGVVNALAIQQQYFDNGFFQPLIAQSLQRLTALAQAGGAT